MFGYKQNQADHTMFIKQITVFIIYIEYKTLGYLKSAPSKGILFLRHDHLKLDTYNDVDWAGSIDNKQSTSGYCTFIGGNLVTLEEQGIGCCGKDKC